MLYPSALNVLYTKDVYPTSSITLVLTRGIEGLKSMLESDDDKLNIYGYYKVPLLVGLNDILAGREDFQLGTVYVQH